MITFSSLPFDAADAADILIVAVAIYTALRFLSANRHYFLLTISATIAGIYFAAHAFGLILTERLFNLGIAACGIVLAIAFQDDIRRSIHRLANWRPFQRHTPVGPDYLDRLAEFTFASAERRIGALIVIKGRDRLDTYLSGGIQLAAPVHPALLDSIFDPHSAGHDGAVVIEDGQITQMCAHLPLGTMFAESAIRGTRHRAALGLSEETDAVVLVVSEESASVSAAHRGRLERGLTPEQVRTLLGGEAQPAPPAALGTV